MQVLDERHCIIKTPEVIDYLHRCALSEPSLAAVVTDLQPNPQEWGSSALHFAAHLRATGEPVLVKLNVEPGQLWWTRALAREYPALIPHVYAAGKRVANEALGWVVWEIVENGLHPGWHGREFDMLLEAGVAFQRVARTLAPAAQAAGVLGELRVADLAADLERGVQRDAPGPAALVLERVLDDWEWVNSVCEPTICHGDLHMANALCREDPPGGTALLIDYHPTLMPWAYEPAKPEILNADPARAGCRNLVARQAAIRARHGLSVPAAAALARLQAIVLGWWAIQAWAYIGGSPDPAWRDPAVWRAENEAYIAAAAAA